MKEDRMEKMLVDLKQYFGYDEFRPLQAEAIEKVLDGRDVILVMPTGGGKSLCFQLPAILMKKMVIVISPLISLMKDQVDSLRANGIEAAALNSSLNYIQQNNILKQCREGKINLLYLSPERLVTDISIFSKMEVGLYAVDEAHCISQWGHDFRPEYTQLKMIKKRYPETPVMALTATADKITRKDIALQLGLIDPEIFVASFNRPNLSLNVRSGFTSSEKYRDILRVISRHGGESGIIYCLSRKETERVSGMLTENGISSAFYHAGMDSKARHDAQEAFIHDKVTVICATIAFGLGIDKPDVRWVIHNNLPKNIESYYQEIGRSGRDGLDAETILYYSTGDLIKLQQFAAESGQSQLNLEKLQRMQQYAEAYVCRRRVLITYFGENFQEDCGNCDICKSPREPVDGLLITQKAVSALIRMGEGCGTHMLIDVLRGSKREEIVQKGYHKIKTFGSGSNLSYHEWQAYLLQLLNLGVFEIAYDEGFCLKVTAYGKEIVYGHSDIQLVKPVIVEKRLPKRSHYHHFVEELEMKMALEDLLKESLKNLRKRLADAKDVPPYVIFNDVTLEALVTFSPYNQLELLDIKGMSRHKVMKYGKDILDVIVSLSPPPKNPKGQTYIETLELYNQGLSLEEISRRRGRKVNTILGHLEHLLLKGMEVDISRLISEEQLVQVCQARNVLSDATLQEYFEYLKEEVPYDMIRIALAAKS